MMGESWNCLLCVMAHGTARWQAEDLPAADLVIVAGTSLVVGPANTIASDTPRGTLRLVVNRERVGEELGIRWVQRGRGAEGL